jgi:hypothetical protein
MELLRRLATGPRVVGPGGESIRYLIERGYARCGDSGHCEITPAGRHHIAVARSRKAD